MEWFYNFIESARRGAFVSTLQSFTPIDWVFFVFVIWGVARGSKLGFGDMFSRLIVLLVVGVSCLSIYPLLSKIITRNIFILNEKVSNPIAFFIYAAIIWIVLSWLSKFLGKFFHIEGQGLLKILGGLILGVAHSLILMSFIIQFVLLFPLSAIKDTFKPGKTYTGYTVSTLLPDIRDAIVSPFSPKSTLGIIPKKSA